MTIIVLKGKAAQVFRYLELLAEKQGHKTLGELIQEVK
jgi:hypothetical protein